MPPEISDDLFKATCASMRVAFQTDSNAAYALHCALISYRMYEWKNKVIRYAKDSPDVFRFPAVDYLEMPLQILNRFYPDVWSEVSEWPVGRIVDAANAALYPIEPGNRVH